MIRLFLLLPVPLWFVTGFHAPAQEAATYAEACPAAQGRCVTCHMPKIELPGAHFRFTDHRIRIVKPNEPYPG